MSELDYTTKICKSCEEEKHVTCFPSGGNYKGKQYLHSYCQECVSQKNADYKSNPERKEHIALANRKSYLQRTYGISLEQYNQMFKEQNGQCAICDKHQDKLKKRLAVDHNHATGEIRGLLCDYCNHRVIGRHRDGNLLRRMADYVDGGTGWFVPKKKRPVKRKPRK